MLLLCFQNDSWLKEVRFTLWPDFPLAQFPPYMKENERNVSYRHRRNRTPTMSMGGVSCNQVCGFSLRRLVELYVDRLFLCLDLGKQSSIVALTEMKTKRKKRRGRCVAICTDNWNGGSKDTSFRKQWVTSLSSSFTQIALARSNGYSLDSTILQKLLTPPLPFRKARSTKK